MHELSICRSLFETAQSVLAERGLESRVEALTVEVGRFTAVVPDALRFAFDVLARGTPFEGARLDIVEIPLRTRCTSCGLEREPEEPALLCPACEGIVAILAGRELRLTAIDLAEAAA